MVNMSIKTQYSPSATELKLGGTYVYAYDPEQGKMRIMSDEDAERLGIEQPDNKVKPKSE